MLRYLPFAAAFSLLCTSASAAELNAGPWYAGIQGGATYLMDADNTGDGSSVSIKSETDVGFALGGFGGYRFSNGIRLEGEVTYRRNSMDKLTITNDGGIGVAAGVGSLNGLSAKADGEVSSLSFMGNLWFEPQVGAGLLPYIGGGIGGSRVSADVDALGAKIVDDSDFVLAGQVGGGVGYAVARNFVLSVDYRFLMTTDPSLEDSTGASFDSEYMNHTVMVGFRGHY